MSTSNFAPALSVKGLTRRYGLRSIIRNITMNIAAGDVVAITGRNGSGKSTLLRMLADLLAPSDGTIEWRIDGADVDRDRLRKHVGLVAPYLQLYTEFSAWEHAVMVQDLRGLPFDESYALSLFNALDLAGRRDDRLSEYSSGMLQRVRFICALVHSPSFLFLDEPTTNLDTTGIAMVHSLIRSGARERVTVIATNEPEDLAVCTKRLELTV